MGGEPSEVDGALIVTLGSLGGSKVFPGELAIRLGLFVLRWLVRRVRTRYLNIYVELSDQLILKAEVNCEDSSHIAEPEL